MKIYGDGYADLGRNIVTSRIKIVHHLFVYINTLTSIRGWNYNHFQLGDAINIIKSQMI